MRVLPPQHTEMPLAQGLLGAIRDKQRKLQEAHERTKTVTRTGEMKEIRERMQARTTHASGGPAAALLWHGVARRHSHRLLQHPTKCAASTLHGADPPERTPGKVLHGPAGSCRRPRQQARMACVKGATWPPVQDDIEEVNKAARTVKLRLERLDKANEASLARKARMLPML